MANALSRLGEYVARGLAGWSAEELVGYRRAARTSQVVTDASALRNSGVWACLRLRADLMSTFPLDVYRPVGNTRVEVKKPPVLVNPGGEYWDYQDWMYATQFDLDRAGNAFGLITERDGNNRPSRIELQALNNVTVVEKADTGQIIYRVRNKEYTTDQVWHERQYPVAGLPVGLSPVAHAAWVISEGLSIQQFAESWFGRGAIPSSHLRNTRQTVPKKQSDEIKQRFLSSVQIGEPFVSGVDWEYKPLQAEAMGMEWLEDRKFSLTDISRFFGVPADLIDAAVSGQSVTYATITERNLQFLIMNLNPAVIRRETKLTKLLMEPPTSKVKPRYVKLNTDALLRMSPKARAEMIKMQIDSRVLTNTEGRALGDNPPLTPEQIDEFATIYGPPRTAPTTAVS